MEIIECKVCGSKVKKWQWEKHLETKTHKSKIKDGELVEDVVIEIDWKRCRKCRSHRSLDMYSGENATCNKCLDSWHDWANRNPEKRKEGNKKYWDEHKEEKRKYNEEYRKFEIDCEVCGCKIKKSNWARHVKTGKHILGVNGGNLVGADEAR